MANATSVAESPLPELAIALGLLRLDGGHPRDLSSSVAVDRSVGGDASGSIFWESENTKIEYTCSATYGPFGPVQVRVFDSSPISNPIPSTLGRAAARRSTSVPPSSRLKTPASVSWNPTSAGRLLALGGNMGDHHESRSGSGESLALPLTRDSPQLVALLKEMKDGLDVVTSKVDVLTQKVRENQFPTSEGMSYLDAKYLLLLSYCQSIVYYLLRKAKGLSIQDHPVVKSLVEIRLFLEKIRPIDKKLEYQTQKLIRAASNFVSEKISPDDKEKKFQDEEDPLKYRPNPDMLVSKSEPGAQDAGGVYRPPRFAPTSMDEDKISKQEKQALRREKALLRQAKQSAYVKELMDDFEDRPEELRENIGAESRELTRYLAKREERARQEEEIFTRAPVAKRDKQIEKHMKNSRNGLLGLTDGFYDEIRMLPMEEKENDETSSHMNNDKRGKKFKRRKRKH
ncbi:Sas10/Utp3/C1D family [Musa troglodytarum]|uniref:Sas10/Utp3/C1D family n=1 Tax=Musa troglodytarum TaxID=320322 RepID=A0A9E7K186_9LILI|nr:Sas10/Utp3/C1D family [Musa troglodytarum]